MKMKIRLIALTAMLVTMCSISFAQHSLRSPSSTKGEFIDDMPVGKSFYIQSVMAKGTLKGHWDIPGGKNPALTNGKNVEVWERNGGCDQKFTLIQSPTNPGYFRIVPCNSETMRVNVDGGSTSNGTNIELWSTNWKNRQEFRFKHMGNGKFKIVAKNGRVVCLDGRSHHNGSNIHLWEDHTGPWMEWYLIDTHTTRTFIPR